MRTYSAVITVGFFAESDEAAMETAERIAFREDGGSVTRLIELDDKGDTVAILQGETVEEALARRADPNCSECKGAGTIYYMDDGPTSRDCDCVPEE